MLYCFGETRGATLALLTFTTPLSWPCGATIAKFSGHVVTFRSWPTVLAETSMSGSTSTRILFGKLPRAISRAATLLSLYRIVHSLPLWVPSRWLSEKKRNSQCNKCTPGATELGPCPTDATRGGSRPRNRSCVCRYAATRTSEATIIAAL